MPSRKPILTNFSKGEASPLIEGRPDLAGYFEMMKVAENFLMLRQGGVTRRPGLRFVGEVKDHTRDTIIIPFEASMDDAYILEMGHNYARIYKGNSRIAGVELATPYNEALLREIHTTQSVDVMWLFNENIPQHKLSRISDTNWSLLPIRYNAPPSFEADTDISGGATLTPGAVTGTTVIFHASAAVFIAGDVGRLVIYGSSRAIITSLGASAGDTGDPNDDVRADILDDFPNTDAIASGSWFLRGSPQATLDPDKKEPVGSLVNLVASVSAFRAADIGKFIKVYAGLLKIKTVTDPTHATSELLSVMTGTDSANPSAAPAGAWSLEIPSWSATAGYPHTGEFYQGRLAQAATPTQKTTFWLSASDDFDNYAIGLEADKAIEYTMATRGLNIIQWIADNIDMFVGTGGSEHRVTGGKSDEPLGGDVIPLVTAITKHGSMHIQPTVISRRVIFVERGGREIFSIAFSLEEDGYDALELTGASEHITEGGVRPGPIAYQKRMHPRIYFVRNDGTLIVLTFFHHEKVIGFTRLVTNGTFESVACIPGSGAHSEHDHVWVVVKRIVNGEAKRYIELFEEDAEELAARPWTSCQTDSARVYDLAGTPTTVLGNLNHLEGMEVDVITDGSYRGTSFVTNGEVQLLEPASQTAEVGLHYDSTLTTMRPAFPNDMVEGQTRSWIKCWARLFETVGGEINDHPIEYPPTPDRIVT